MADKKFLISDMLPFTATYCDYFNQVCKWSSTLQSAVILPAARFLL